MRSVKVLKIGTLSVRNSEEDYGELLANIRRLTVMVLDNLEAGSRDRTLDQGQKWLLSSTGARLLRLWRAALREAGAREGVENLFETKGAGICGWTPSTRGGRRVRAHS